MRARNFQGWDAETFAEDPDEATKVYFNPPEPETDPVATAAIPTPTGVRSFEVDGTWRVPSLSAKSVAKPAPLARVPASTNPPPARIPASTNPPPAQQLFTTKAAPELFPGKPLPLPPQPDSGSYSQQPAPLAASYSPPVPRMPPPLSTSASYSAAASNSNAYASTSAAYPSAVSLPHFEPSSHARPSRPSRRFQRPALGVFVAAACVLVGIGVGGFLAATGHSHAAVDAAPAKVVMSPTVTMTPAPAVAAAAITVEPIAEPAPAPAAPAAAAALPPPQPTFAAPPKKHHTTVVSAPAVDAGSGKLAVSSKPPCSIVIDGKDTGLVAPQRAIELAAGKHEVTLINAEQGIHLTTEVAITADRSTQLIRDFTN